jgi:hypothetical protein
MNSRILLALLAFFSASQGFSQRRIYVNEYLNIGVGARGLAMAGAQSATSSDVTSGYWNPAGLMHVADDLQVGLMHAEYFSGNANYDYGAAALPLKGKQRVVGISLLRFAIDNIPNTIDYVQPDGSFDENQLKSISAGDYAVLLSYAQGLKLFKNPKIETRVGGNAKIIYRHLGSMANAWGAGIDLGIQGSYGAWQFGIMAKDITTTYTAWSFHLTEKEKQVFYQTGNEIPVKSYEIMYPRLNFGIARSFLKKENKIQIMAELDADVTTDGKRNTVLSGNTVSVDPHLGVEASYKNTIFLRLGVGNFQRVLDDRDTLNQKKYTIYQPAVGVGIHLNNFIINNFDYAFTSLQAQSNPLYTHVISIRVDINRQNKSGNTRKTKLSTPTSL